MIGGLTKISEFRPAPCGTRIGDIVEIEGQRYLQIKCRKCSKSAGKDVFHYASITV
jgi:predicted nucleic-acid-binding Zn-ribbon protein